MALDVVMVSYYLTNMTNTNSLKTMTDSELRAIFWSTADTELAANIDEILAQRAEYRMLGTR